MLSVLWAAHLKIPSILICVAKHSLRRPDDVSSLVSSLEQCLSQVQPPAPAARLRGPIGAVLGTVCGGRLGALGRVGRTGGGRHGTRGVEQRHRLGRRPMALVESAPLLTQAPLRWSCPLPKLLVALRVARASEWMKKLSIQVLDVLMNELAHARAR